MSDENWAAGWYPDWSGSLRWWDGSAWTSHVQAAPAGPEKSKAEAVRDGWRKVKAQAAEAQSAMARGSSDPEVLFRGQVDFGVFVSIFKDGTFLVERGKRRTARDRLISIEQGSDSMRRKSVTGRGVAAMATSGFSLATHNNRGVVYLRLVGETTGLHSWTKRNPTNDVLDAMRSLKVAADSVLVRRTSEDAEPGGGPESDLSSQLQRLSQMHLAGNLTDEEFASAKAKLLS